MDTIQLPDGPRLVQFSPPWIVAKKHRPRQDPIDTSPSMEKKQMDKEVDQSMSQMDDESGVR